jgi:hypothetical protein
MSDRFSPIEIESTAPAPKRSRLFTRLFGVLLITIAVVAGVYLFVAYFAWETGQTLRQEEALTQRTVQLTHQIELAQEDLNNGSVNLALRRLEWVLAQEPGNTAAAALHQQAQSAQAALAQPTAATTPELRETVSAADSTPQLEPEPELARIRRLANGEQWEELLPALLTFQQQYPSHERAETDQLLYDAYLGLGLAYLETEKVELGLSYLSQAEGLGNLPQEALDYRGWADLYLQGMGYYGVNWNVAASNFRDLCLSAPFFHNSCQLLQESLINYGDQMAFAQEWCPAQFAYQEAWQQQRSETLGGKLAQAQQGCAAATPTPAAVFTSTVPFTNTIPITGTGE